MTKKDLEGQFYGSTPELAQKMLEKFIKHLKTVPIWETVFWFIFIVAFIWFSMGALPALLGK